MWNNVEKFTENAMIPKEGGDFPEADYHYFDLGTTSIRMIPRTAR